MKRKIVNLLLGTMVTVVFAMTGCGEKKTEETAAVAESSESATAATEAVEKTEEVTEESTESEAEALLEEGKHIIMEKTEQSRIMQKHWNI